MYKSPHMINRKFQDYSNGSNNNESSINTLILY